LLHRRPNPAHGLPINPALDGGVRPTKKGHNVGLIAGVVVGAFVAGTLLLLVLFGE